MTSETKKRWLIFGGFLAVVIVLYYYLRNLSGPQQITYPNDQASGVPASSNPASVWNIFTPSPSPSPAAIYAPPPALPPTPNFMSYNNSPVNLTGPTTNNIKNVGQTTGCNGSSCGGCCGCSACPTGGTYGDGNQQQCLSPNPSAAPACAGTLIQNPDGSISCYDPVIAGTASAIGNFFQTGSAPQ